MNDKTRYSLIVLLLAGAFAWRFHYLFGDLDWLSIQDAVVRNASANVTVLVLLSAVIALIVGRRFLGSSPLFSKPCQTCGAPAANDRYVLADESRLALCRRHLVARWAEDFRAAKEPMLVIEPNFKEYPLAYLYATPETLVSWEYPDAAAAKVRDLIAGIAGQRCACGATATIAFLRAQDFPIPLFENISASPAYLCVACTLPKVEPLLAAAPGTFGEGVFAPRPEPGVFHCQEY